MAGLFGDLGVHWVEADVVAREVVEPGTTALTAIAEHFGAGILTADGALDRAALRVIVFKAPEERVWLEQLLHPLIRQELLRQLDPDNYALPYTLLVSPLLLESDQRDMVAQVVVVDVLEDTQITRTMARDINDRAQVERIMATQLPREERCAKADDIIDNDRSLTEVAEQVLQLHQQFLAAFS